MPRTTRALLVVWLLGAAACSAGSTEVTTGPAGATEPSPTGPTATGATGVTAVTGPTGPTADASIAGTWAGTWQSSVFEVSGTFEMTFEETATGFTGTIRIQGSSCVSQGKVEATVDGTAITIGAVQAEQAVAFEGEIVGDGMAGTYTSTGCGDDRGTWEAGRAD